ncbi:hypothetical protein A6A19_06170 [Actinobacillus delphinicola]|uniref:DUF805 domain-containing protein n=1 Tax=Actinobacillus delphinicola TaxID=51161 RepID=UPI0024428C2F|nr:DUF805 domain-containing protein [Actinobacillus delphinicola]MDG6897578.1 hypothetical protein [Actinobacillus delphinicola]
MNYFFQNFIDTVKNFSFKGRATRKQYWLFVLAQILVFILIGIITAISFACSVQFAQSGNSISMPIAIFTFVINTICSAYPLVILIQTWAITARRLHDVNLSGWWQLIGFIPLIGNIILFILLVLPSRNENNRFNLLPEQK